VIDAFERAGLGLSEGICSVVFAVPPDATVGTARFGTGLSNKRVRSRLRAIDH
jgi:hypothetical protein